MLIISRHIGERVRFRVGTVEMWIEVAELNANRVRLGITAPAEVKILREELIDAAERPPRPVSVPPVCLRPGQ